MNKAEGFDRELVRHLLGIDMPAGTLSDLVAAKIAMWSDPRRRSIKRLQDEIEILRLAEAYPEIVDPLLPEALLREVEANREHAAEYPEGDGWGD